MTAHPEVILPRRVEPAPLDEAGHKSHSGKPELAHLGRRIGRCGAGGEKPGLVQKKYRNSGIA